MNSDTSPDSQPIRMETSLDLMLALLYAPGKSGLFGEAIDGITRLQKLLFLLQQGKGPKSVVAQAKQYLYRPYKMGPFSEGVRDDLQILQSAGLLRTETLEYLLTDDKDGPLDDDGVRQGIKRVLSLRFILTSDGKDAAKALWSGLTQSERDGITEFKRFFNSLSLRQLLIFVYEKYPKFASASEIKEQLGL